jgi:hypothetical protein
MQATVMTDIIEKEQLQSSIAKALLYSDIFSYPLTAEEVYRRLPTNHTHVDEVREALGRMKQNGLVFQFGDFFSIRNEQELESRRSAGNRLARKIMPKAIRRGQLLIKFPFIRAVMISGSLSKNYMDEDSDMDYFVIAAPGRLWIARLILAAFKRIFFRNSNKSLCVNYWVDSDHLEIEEKNIFTATELATLIPVANTSDYAAFISSNLWINDYYPNHSCASAESAITARPSWFKRTVESFIDPAGEILNGYILKIALRRYQRRYAHLFSASDFTIAFKSRKGISKNHDRHYQKHITELYYSKLERFKLDHPQSHVA